MHTGQQSDTSPLISCCLIVKNEAELLPRFLAQAAGLWDELCVVDTGSTDGTLAILRAAGAKIIERPWDDDFAAARNAGLEAATGRWIVCLDADEMVSATFVTQVRALAADEHAGAATIRIVNTMPHGGINQAQLLRIFRNDASIRFRHRIHEEVASSVSVYLARTGLALRSLPAAVDHLGYQRDRALARGKRSRDEALLRQAIAEDPKDLYSHYKLLELARFWSDASLGKEVAAACVAAIAQVGQEVLDDQPFGGDLVALLATNLHGADPARALAFLHTYAAHLSDSAAFYLRQGEWLERAGDPVGAVESFGHCLDLADTTSDRELATVRPLMGLARIALARPQGLEQAWTFTEQALLHNHRDPEALLAATSICRMAGGNAMVNQFVADYTGKFGATPELTQALSSV